ncbi:MAG: hypothetical protein QOD06_2418 [Candidatus Binatota bacterium]|nr:hypothetical protein [Candidatus Binatota bacterium]
MTVTAILPVSSYDEETVGPAIRRIVASAVSGGDGPLARPRRDALVVVKPNWIQQSHEDAAEVWEPIITHPTIVLSTVDALAEAMGGIGTIVVCDAPHTYASFADIVARGGFAARLAELRRKWPQLGVECVDVRREVWTMHEGIIASRVRNADDPRGYVRLDLATDSLFFGRGSEGRYYGADYDQAGVNRHHRGRVHEYLISGTAMKCDLFVNLPKLKTHKKTGVTCALKNLVGINGDKNWLPHHTEGNPANGGDEFPEIDWRSRVEARAKRLAHRFALRAGPAGTWILGKGRRVGTAMLGDSDSVVRNGNWHGNDTCWRMALDLNRALLYGDATGSWRERGGRKPYLAIVDGIVGGEGNGPLSADAVASGVLIAGTDPAAVDATACRLMGFDPSELRIVARAFDEHRWPIATGSLADVRVDDERVGARIPLDAVEPAIPGGFRPHFGWQNLRRCA